MFGVANAMGGRLPLVDPESLKPNARQAYDLVNTNFVPWADAAGFRAKDEAGRLIGPFNSALYSPEMSSAFLDWQSAEQKHTSLDHRMREIVILTVGAVWRSDYELYAHSAVARKAGLSDAAIARLCAGEEPDDLTPSEALAHRVARQLTANRQVTPALFEKAKAALGLRSLVDLVNLVGAYQNVCGLLNTFAIPTPEATSLPTEEKTMSAESAPPVRLSIACNFPEQFFLENIAVRHDNSLLISVVTRKELYYVPPITGDAAAEPILLHTFEEMAAGIAELAPDLFLVMTTNAYTTHTNHLFRLDLRGWVPGAPVTPEPILTLPEEVRSLNGCCALSPTVVLAADSFGGAIWRFDLDAEARRAEATLWLAHDNMAHVDVDLPPPPQPGINGVRYSATLGHVYYTTTGQKLFMRVAVDPATLAPTSKPEELGRGGMYDDFCLDEARGLAFVTVHRENRLDRLPLAPGAGASPPLVGARLDERLIGPSSVAWSRRAGEERQVMFVTTDGGTTAPPPNLGVLNAKVVKVVIGGE